MTTSNQPVSGKPSKSAALFALAADPWQALSESFLGETAIELTKWIEDDLDALVAAQSHFGSKNSLLRSERRR